MNPKQLVSQLRHFANELDHNLNPSKRNVVSFLNRVAASMGFSAYTSIADGRSNDYITNVRIPKGDTYYVVKTADNRSDAYTKESVQSLLQAIEAADAVEPFIPGSFTVVKKLVSQQLVSQGWENQKTHNRDVYVFIKDGYTLQIYVLHLRNWGARIRAARPTDGVPWWYSTSFDVESNDPAEQARQVLAEVDVLVSQHMGQ